MDSEMVEVHVDTYKDAYFVDFGAERKKSESKVSSAQFWGDKVMSSWAQLEYNHGLAMKKWAESQRGYLRYSDDGCPDVLKNCLGALVENAERKAVELMNIQHHVEDHKAMGNALISYETRDYKPTMERLSKEMNYLVTSQRIREARSKREGKKYQDSMKKIRDKERILADVTHAQGRSDIAIGRISECQSQAVATLDRYISTVRKERTQRRDFLRYALHLQEMWSKKQRERLCLLLTSIQGFAKKIKSSDVEIAKHPPAKQIKDTVKRADISAIVKDLESQYTKVYICPQNTDLSSLPQENFRLHHSSSAPRGRLVSRQSSNGQISPRKTVTLPNVADAVSSPESRQRPTILRKRDNSPSSLTRILSRNRISRGENVDETSMYTPCFSESPGKEVTFTPMKEVSVEPVKEMSLPPMKETCISQRKKAPATLIQDVVPLVTPVKEIYLPPMKEVPISPLAEISVPSMKEVSDSPLREAPFLLRNETSISPVKEASLTPLPRRLMTPTNNISPVRSRPSELSRLTPLEGSTPTEDISDCEQAMEEIFVNRMTPSQTLATVQEESELQARRNRMSGANVDEEDARISSPNARPPTPVDQVQSCLTESPMKTPKPGRRTTIIRRYTPDSRPLRPPDPKPLTPNQACRIFLKVSAAARKNRANQIFKKNIGIGRRRIFNPSPSRELASRALVLVKRSSNTNRRPSDKT